MIYTAYYIQYNNRITKLSKYRKYIAKNTLKNIHSLPYIQVSFKRSSYTCKLFHKGPE